MTESSRAVLDAFEKLAPAAQAEVIDEILRRARGGGRPGEEWLVEAADELFRHYDAEENPRASGV